MSVQSGEVRKRREKEDFPAAALRQCSDPPLCELGEGRKRQTGANMCLRLQRDSVFLGCTHSAVANIHVFANAICTYILTYIHTRI